MGTSVIWQGYGAWILADLLRSKYFVVSCRSFRRPAFDAAISCALEPLLSVRINRPMRALRLRSSSCWLRILRTCRPQSVHSNKMRCPTTTRSLSADHLGMKTWCNLAGPNTPLRSRRQICQTRQQNDAGSAKQKCVYLRKEIPKGYMISSMFVIFVLRKAMKAFRFSTGAKGDVELTTSFKLI